MKKPILPEIDSLDGNETIVVRKDSVLMRAKVSTITEEQQSDIEEAVSAYMVANPAPRGPAGFSTVAPSTPTRTIGGAAFRPNASKAVLCTYSIKTTVTNPLLIGASTATVTLLSDDKATPTTERARVSAESSVGLAVTIALTQSNVASLTYLVPAGHYVRLVQSVTGTGQAAIISQTEEVLG